MKYFSLTFLWALGVGMTFMPGAASLTEADATDDFSISLPYSGSGEVYKLIPEHRVHEVLADRLDAVPKSLVPRLAKHLVSLCKKHRFDPVFILSLIEVESAFRVKAVSPVGAIGLMQVMLPTGQYVLREIGYSSTGHENFNPEKLDQGVLNSAMLMEPFTNISIGITYLAWLRDYYEGMAPYYILAAYNVGPARMDELLARESFKPTETKKYFLSIVTRMPHFRSYKPTLPKRSKRSRRIAFTEKAI